MTTGKTIGVLPLGRPTFDVPFAEETLAEMLHALDAIGHRIVGPRSLLMDGASGAAAIAELTAQGPDLVLVLQVTFTDAMMIARVSDAFRCPLAIWAPPEPRLGGRLRLNAFCGLNLASHALSLRGRPFAHAYGKPDSVDLETLLSGRSSIPPLAPGSPNGSAARGRGIAGKLAGRKIARIGDHPDGFDTCAYDSAKLRALTGLGVEAHPLSVLFDRAKSEPAERAAKLRTEAETSLAGLDAVDQQQLDRSLRLKLALDGMRADGGYDAFAIRCWPETFTEYGGAVCGPVSMMGEKRIPCACEADVYGAATQLLLQEIAGAPVFLADLVDLDDSDDTGVVWHCGQAPLSMADPDAIAEATIHTNRKMPLLYEFPLRPGPVTFARLSQARGHESLVIAGGEMLKRPKAFTGTSGTVRFSRPAAEMLDRVMASGLEHHMALAYGDHAAALEDFASAAGLPVLHL